MKKLYNIVKKWWKEEGYSPFHNFLREEALEILCTKMPFAMTANAAVAVTLFYFLYPAIHSSLLVVWLFAVLLLSFYRGASSHKKCREDHKTLETRYRQFRREALAMALLWMLLPIFFYPQNDIVLQLLMLLLLMGIAIGGALNIIIEQKISNLYIILLLGAFALRFVAFDSLHILITLLLIIFIVTLLFGTRLLHGIMLKGIRQRRHLDDLQHRLDQIFKQAPVGILYFNTDYIVIDLNDTVTEIFHIPKEMIRNRHLLQIKDRRPIQDLPKVIEEGATIRYEGPYLTMTTNEEIWVSVIFSPIRDSMGKIAGGVAVIQDKTVEHEALMKAEFLAYHDPLTHLPNRKLLEDRYRLQINQAAREGYYSAMLFLDLDRFKHINDNYGHNIGDELIKETARRLQKVLRRNDTICRLGGDEFIIFLPMISKEPEKALTRIWSISEKIHQVLQEPFKLNNRTLYVTASVGAILIYGNREPLDEILRKIDIAMYHAKHKGKGVTTFYEENMDKSLRRTIELEHALRYAIEREELYLEFQPIVNAKEGRIYAAETLLRWRMNDGILISPVEFIPVAEESMLIHEMGMWLIEKACEAIKQMHKESLFNLQYISVNISSKQLGNHNFFEEVMAIIRHHRIDPRMLKFEITESILMEDPHNARQVIERFNEAGINFLIDDFGTGYSSLSYLKTFRFDTIKIDRSFIRDILDDPDDVTLVKAILDIAHQFNNRVVAEGVEKFEQIAKLEALEPDILCQGFYYSPPLSLEKFKEWVTKHS